MTFDPNTIEHLGVRMYSTLPPVLSELIANGHDADSENIIIILKDEGEGKEILIEDDGIGMSFEEINNKFLRIGRNRRIEDEEELTPKGRKVIGKKGLGKLAFFGIAHEIEISTKKNGKENVFAMNWENIKSTNGDYEPEIIKKETPCDPSEHGTKIYLKKIQRESDFSAKRLANSISKIFIIDPGFRISIQRNNEGRIIVENKLKYSELEKEIEWKIQEDSSFESDYKNANKIVGQLIATKRPISPKTNMRGITLFSRKKLVNIPEYFSESISSHFFSYLTGWLEVDFIDDLEEDVIETNRRSINWGHPEMQTLRNYLQGLIKWLEQDWRHKRTEIRNKQIEKKTGVKVNEWRKQLPDNINKDLDPVVRALIEDAEVPEEATVESLRGLQRIIKPYPYFHWRNLHPQLKKVVFNYYKAGDYYTAVFEGVKKYLNEIKKKSGQALTDRALIENVFSINNPKLSVTRKYKKPTGENFEEDTINNITQGHRMLALAIWQGCRSPIAHEEVLDLKDSGLFTERDCLDALSCLSHLFYRLENSEKLNS